MKLNFTWSWQQVAVFTVLVTAGIVLVVTKQVEWKALVSFAVGLLYRNPFYLTKESSDESNPIRGPLQ